MKNFHLSLSCVNLWALYTLCSGVNTGQTLSWWWPFFHRHEISHITANSLHPWTLFIPLVFSGLACVGSWPLYQNRVFSKLALWDTIQQRKIKKGTEQTVIDRNEKDKRASQHFPPILLLLFFPFSLSCSVFLHSSLSAIKILNILSQSLCLYYKHKLWGMSKRSYKQHTAGAADAAHEETKWNIMAWNHKSACKKSQNVCFTMR